MNACRLRRVSHALGEGVVRRIYPGAVEGTGGIDFEVDGIPIEAKCVSQVGHVRVSQYQVPRIYGAGARLVVTIYDRILARALWSAPHDETRYPRGLAAEVCVARATQLVLDAPASDLLHALREYRYSDSSANLPAQEVARYAVNHPDARIEIVPRLDLRVDRKRARLSYVPLVTIGEAPAGRDLRSCRLRDVPF